MVGLFLGLLRQRPHPWLVAWARGFVFLMGGHVLLGGAALGWFPPWVEVGSTLVFASGLVVVLGGVGSFVGRMPATGWFVATGAGPVLGVGLVAAGQDPALGAALGMASVGLANGVIGWTLVRTGEVGRWVVGGALIGMALHCMAFPVAARLPWTLPYGFVAMNWLQLLAGLGVFLMHLGREGAQAATAEDELAQFLDRAVVGVFRSSPTEGFVFANPALVAMLGYDSEAEVLALKVPEELYLDPEERGRIRGSTDGTELRGHETIWRRADGRPLVVELDGREVRGPDGKVRYWEGFARDVTRARMLEAELGRSQRMEALGRLAGGVAHDFNNLLTVIMGNLELIDEERLGSDQKLFEAAVQSVERAAELTGQLLTFGGPMVAAGVVDARVVLDDVMAVLARTVGPRVRVVTERPESPCWVPLARPRLSQVVMNLALNARDAMPDGGVVSGVVRGGVERANEPGRWVLLEVSDEGEGMPPEVLEHIFEPFFTTRALESGTGLGLATAYTAVREVGGSIVVESRVGVGSTFRVYLPEADEPEPSVPPGSGDEPTLRGTVVVVDDQADVREFVVRSLQHLGYVVQDHGDPRDALEKVAASPPDLLLTDVVMPELSGPQLVAALRGRDVAVPVLFMSGYPRHGDGEQPLDGPLLTKPFTIEALGEAVTKALAGRDET